MNEMSPAPITATVTAYRRIEQTLETLRRIELCLPGPDEILVHVDANQQACADAIRFAFPHVGILVSTESVGPGGGRNRLLSAARNELIASFDDDSFPLDVDYFDRALTLMQMFPEAALIGASIFHQGDTVMPPRAAARKVASFGAGATVFRRSDFLAAGGFVPLVVAYGMEEEDLALRLLDRGRILLHSPWLRIYHDTDLSHHGAAQVTSASIANLALLAWLRYPAAYWPYGGLQVANRVVWCIGAGRRAGVLGGLMAIPAHLARHWHLRQPVSRKTMRERFAARKGESLPFKRSDVRAREEVDAPPERAHDAV